MRGGQEAAEVDEGGAGGPEEYGGLSASTVPPPLLKEALITALPSSVRLLPSIQAVCAPVASHQRGREEREAERTTREKKQRGSAGEQQQKPRLEGGVSVLH